MREPAEGYGIWKLGLSNKSHPKLLLWDGKGSGTPVYNPTNKSLLYPITVSGFLKDNPGSLEKGFLTMKNPLHLVTGGYWGQGSGAHNRPASFGTVLTRSHPKGRVTEGVHGYKSSAVRISEIYTKDEPCSICLEKKGRKILPIRGKNLLLCNKCYGFAEKASKRGLDLPDIQDVYWNLGRDYDAVVSDAKYHPMLEGRIGPALRD